MASLRGSVISVSVNETRTILFQGPNSLLQVSPSSISPGRNSAIFDETPEILRCDESEADLDIFSKRGKLKDDIPPTSDKLSLTYEVDNLFNEIDCGGFDIAGCTDAWKVPSFSFDDPMFDIPVDLGYLLDRDLGSNSSVMLISSPFDVCSHFIAGTHYDPEKAYGWSCPIKLHDYDYRSQVSCDIRQAIQCWFNGTLLPTKSTPLIISSRKVTNISMAQLIQGKMIHVEIVDAVIAIFRSLYERNERNWICVDNSDVMYIPMAPLEDLQGPDYEFMFNGFLQSVSGL